MNSRKFSAKVKKIIKVSREEAIRLGHDYIGTEHFLLGLLHEHDSLPVKVLQALDVDIEKLRKEIENTRVEKMESDLGLQLW
jgi:ATP-dependent Clp protease ATP-binding subunit ClpC